MALREVTRKAGLSEEECAAFDRDGYLVIEGALAPGRVEELTAAVDRTYERRGADGAPLHLLAFLGEDPAFIELLDQPAVLSRVVDILGPSIFCHHCHLDVHPPEPEVATPKWMWHQDGGVQNRDLETDPRPRLSVEIAYFLTDASQPDRGNLLVLPGSHLLNGIERPADDDNDLAGATPILVPPGGAVLFDRRLWHMRSRNRSDITRKALFLAYTFRWVRPRDAMHIPLELLGLLTPIRAQLLGAGVDPLEFWMPDHMDLPLGHLLG